MFRVVSLPEVVPADMVKSLEEKVLTAKQVLKVLGVEDVKPLINLREKQCYTIEPQPMALEPVGL
jgi:hypothetical protein